VTARRDASVRAAVAELRSIRSDDPCAAIAMTTIKATIHTLETRWLVDGDGCDGGDDRSTRRCDDDAR
jgi:hypothetical protein